VKAACLSAGCALCSYMVHSDEALADLTWCRRTGRIIERVSAVEAGRIPMIVEEPALWAQRCSVQRSSDNTRRDRRNT
jgi:hypothetical protein